MYFISISPLASGDVSGYNKPFDGNVTVSVGIFNSAI
jgi:hypothetical protein